MKKIKNLINLFLFVIITTFLLSCNEAQDINPLTSNKQESQKDLFRMVSVGYTVYTYANYYAPGSDVSTPVTLNLYTDGVSFVDVGLLDTYFDTPSPTWYDGDGGMYEVTGFAFNYYTDWTDSYNSHHASTWTVQRINPGQNIYDLFVQHLNPSSGSSNQTISPANFVTSAHYKVTIGYQNIVGGDDKAK